MRRFGFGYRWRALAAGALLVGLAAVPPAAALAATDTVSVCDDGSAAGTLRNVIANAAANDTVKFSCSGTITLASTITLDKNLTIDGDGAPGPVTISGGHTATVLAVIAASSNGVIVNLPTVTLNDLTIANGNGTGGEGGGIVNSSGTLTVSKQHLQRQRREHRWRRWRHLQHRLQCDAEGRQQHLQR